MQNRTSGPYVAPAFSPPPYAVAVNALFFASLGVVLVAAFLCMLVKGWIRELDRKLRGIPDLQKRAVIKELREQGLLRWRLPELITILPSLSTFPSSCFFIGLAVYLSQIHKLPAFLSISIFGIGVFVYVLSIFISAIDDFSPFRSPYSRADHDPGPMMKQIISHTSVPILNRVLNSVNPREPSAISKNIYTSILLQLDNIDIRPPNNCYLPWHYDNSNLSIKEAKCLAYTTCMLRATPISRPFSKSIRASIGLLDQTSDPWSQLVAALISDLESDWPTEIGQWLGPHPGFTRREAGLLQLISKVAFSEAQWCFVVTSIAAPFIWGTPEFRREEILALTRMLVRLLQMGVFFGRGEVFVNNHTDLWLFVMMSVLDEEMMAPTIITARHEQILHARDLDTCAKGMIRDPSNIRRLLRLSKQHNLDLVLMRECLVSILFNLISHNPRGPQARRLINEYLEIIIEEMGMNAWSSALSELKLYVSTASYGAMSRTLLSLLRGECFDSLGDREARRSEQQMVLQEYDLRLRAVNAQPTTPTLKVIDLVMWDWPLITGLELYNSWLSLYTSNVARSPHRAAIPVIWSSDCTYIASGRLGLYDDHVIAPEIDLVVFFLSSPSPSIACRALRWYLHLEANPTTPCHIRHFVAFPVIFRKGLSVDENRQGWLLLVEMLLPRWYSVPPEGRMRFVEAFFGYSCSQGNNQSMTDQCAASAALEDEEVADPLDVGAAVTTGQADGFGWMEDVWMTVLQGLVVYNDRTEAYWSELSGVLHAAYPDSAQPTESKSLLPLSPQETSSENQVVIDPRRFEVPLRDSARGILGVLTRFLGVGVTSMPVALLDRIRNSVLLSDERLGHDVDSLRRIKALLNHNQED
jgi:hypothetical protein